MTLKEVRRRQSKETELDLNGARDACLFAPFGGSCALVNQYLTLYAFILRGRAYTCILNLFANPQFQLAACQQLIEVKLLQFHNMYNAEVVSNRGFCCCDSGRQTCKDRLEDLQLCEQKCDTWFNISLSPCHSPHPCASATAPQCQSTSVQNLDDEFEFVMCNSPNTVSGNKLCMTYCSLHPFWTSLHVCLYNRSVWQWNNLAIII